MEYRKIQRAHNRFAHLRPPKLHLIGTGQWLHRPSGITVRVSDPTAPTSRRFYRIQSPDGRELCQAASWRAARVKLARVLATNPAAASGDLPIQRS